MGKIAGFGNSDHDLIVNSLDAALQKETDASTKTVLSKSLRLAKWQRGEINGEIQGLPEPDILQ